MVPGERDLIRLSEQEGPCVEKDRLSEVEELRWVGGLICALTTGIYDLTQTQT